MAALPWVRMVALSGSVAHLNMESGADLDLFIVTRGRRVWLTAVSVIVLARILGRRRTLCANFLVADTALHFAPQDLFTANQVIGLQPIAGAETMRTIVAANPFVRGYYPNYHPLPSGVGIVRLSWLVRRLRALAERLLDVPSRLGEWICRTLYRAYLRRRSASWTSPEQVILGDDVLKLHTRSHRRDILSRFDATLRTTIDGD
ncbi:MAG: hypothetical protein QM736_04555 [Vicinamibacterales bacterium]